MVMLIALWFSTATTRPFLGKPLGPDAGQQAGHSKPVQPSNRSGELLVMLGLSGGGTRASALSYGVMVELAHTTITVDGRKRRLLDEIDVISSVSGGSFTSAYFGLFGDGLFDDFKEAMLLRPIQDDLIKALFNPANWRDLSSPYFGRSDLTRAYYDDNIFKGKTFADIDPSSAPLIIINASDIGTGQRMVFTRDIFQLLCVDYDSYPVARAVAASSGVPGLETPVLFKNYAGSCGYTLPEWLRNPAQAEKNPMWAKKVESFRDYLDVKKRPWLHLVDGGITDNLGLRQFYEFSSLRKGFRHLLSKLTGDESATVTDVLIISVNAAVEHHLDWAGLPQTPTEGETLGSMTHIQMHNYTGDTLHIVRQSYQDWLNEAKQGGAQANFEFVEIAFSKLADEKERAYMNALPTSLQLNEEQVDKLIETGRRLLRESPSFQQFLARRQFSRGPST